jgi:hypothetical protein
MTFTTAEKYAAFLITYLPRLSALAASRVGEPTGPRLRPLEVAHTFAANEPGVSLEFGVFKGASINFTASTFPDRRYYGFDSFEGFPDDGRPDWDQDFSVEGRLPQVPENVTLIKGFFSETLPPFLDGLSEEIRIVNIDCDIYSSTRDVFRCLTDRRLLKPGVVLAFDELINYRAFLWNEMFALFEVLEQTSLGIQWLSVHQKVRLIEDVMDLVRGGQYPTWNEDLQSGFRQQASLVLTDGGLDLSILKLKYAQRRVKTVALFLREACHAAHEDIQKKLRS